MESGLIKKVLDRYDKQFIELFNAYKNWEKQKVQLNTLALMLRDFELSPDLIMPKTIAEVYKSVGKGQALDQKGFNEAIVKMAYRSEKLA